MTAELHPFPPEEVMAYLDGEVTGERALVLADHLEHCPGCSSLADEFCAVSQQLSAWRVPLAAFEEPTQGLGKEGNAQRGPEMVCSEFPQGLPPSYKEPAARLTARSMLRSPWMWAVACTGAVVAILWVQAVRMRGTLIASNNVEIEQYMSSLKDRLAQDEKANADMEADLRMITDKMKISKVQLEKARAEAERLNEETNEKVTALDTSVHTELATKVSSDDAKNVDTKVVGARTDLDTTKEDLKMAKSEIGTLIARNHDEIDQLRRMGKRDYTEFTITGKNRAQKVAKVTVELRDVDQKHNKFDLAMTVEGKLFVKKNRAANEPIFFFTSGSKVPEEIVINKIGKDSVSGYLSVSVGKMIERTASLSLIVKEVASARAALEEISKQHDGYFAELNTSGEPNARTLMASLRVPADQLESTLADLRKLGQLDEEKQGGEEVSQQYVDLKARLENGRHTEKRLNELLAKRADRLKDVLDVERELASTREDIERMEAQQRNVDNLVNYASISVSLSEEYKPTLNLAPPAVGTRMRNALVDGYHTAADSIVNVILFGLQSGPVILFWLLALFFPARWAWRKLREVGIQKHSLAGAL